MKFFDTHTHVQFAAYDEDRKEVIERALKANVSMINVGTQVDTSAAAVKLANEFFTFSNSRELENKDSARMYATVGLHPVHAEKSFHDEQELGGGEAAKAFTSRGEDFDYGNYKKMALDPKVVAIGECGLDYYHLSEESKARQKEIFIKQIELAKEVQKPLMIHCREAFGDLIEVLSGNRNMLNSEPGVIHFFSGTAEDAKKLLDLGFSFTFGGVVTFLPKAGRPAYDDIVKYIPLDRILSETDAPYVAPMPYRGKRNEPLYVIETVKKLAAIKKVPVEEMAEKIFENARRTFMIE